MLRLTGFGESVDLQPAIIHCITGGPNDRSDASLGQIKLQNRIGQAVRIRGQDAGLWFWWQVQAIASDVGIGCIEQCQIVLITASNVVGKISLEIHHAVVEGLGQTDQRHALIGQFAKVHRMTATGTAHGNRHMLLAWLDTLGIPLAEYS